MITNQIDRTYYPEFSRAYSTRFLQGCRLAVRCCTRAAAHLLVERHRQHFATAVKGLQGAAEHSGSQGKPF